MDEPFGMKKCEAGNDAFKVTANNNLVKRELIDDVSERPVLVAVKRQLEFIGFELLEEARQNIRVLQVY